MRNIHTALPALAVRFPSLASDFRIAHSILLAAGQGLVELPTQVLTAGYSVIGLAPTTTARDKALAGDPSRRLMLLNVASTLESEGYRPEPDDVATAEGVWGTLVGRGAAMHRGLMTDPTLRPRAAAFAAFVSQAGLDLAVIIDSAEQRVISGVNTPLLELRALLKEHPELRRRANATGKAAAQTKLSFVATADVALCEDES